MHFTIAKKGKLIGVEFTVNHKEIPAKLPEMNTGDFNFSHWRCSLPSDLLSFLINSQGEWNPKREDLYYKLLSPL